MNETAELATFALKVGKVNCVVCLGPCFWTRCSECRAKLSSHDFSPEESRRFAEAEVKRNGHECWSRNG